LHEPEPFIDVVLVVGSIGLVVELAVGWPKHEEAAECADELIFWGFCGDARRTPVERAVSDRLLSLEKPRSRRRLANDLRWRLKLAEGTARPSPGYIRASAFPPLGRSQRRVLMGERPLVTKLAARIEQAPVDSRALVILRRFVTVPPPLDAVALKISYQLYFSGESLQT